ncbi:MAG TPA: T9SS sorting signal type C domain-containing protein [Flavobacterium sp.]|nr:T9SS sorting signal type C domain-containing protein [Flavobacterium sp.]
MLLKSVFTIILLLGFSKTSAQIAAWDYEPLQGTLSNPTTNFGIGTSSVVNGGGGTITPGTRIGMAGTGCGTQNGATAWALEPFDPGSVNEANGAQFNASTLGYQNISVTWDQRWSNTCPNTVRLQYTTNGSTWNNFTMTGANTTFCLGTINANGCFEVNTSGDIFTRITVNLSSISAINNNPNFGVRMVASYYQSSGQFRQTSSPGSIAGTAGTWRFDNVAISGTLLPGPTASIISSIAPGSMCAGGSANIKVTITGGTGPFTLTYSDGTTSFVVNNYISGTNIPVSPVATKTYTIVSVVNANGVAGTGNIGSAVITVNALPAVPISSSVTTCSAGAITLTGSPAGGVFSSSNPYSGGTTTFTYTVTNASGCPRTSITYTFTRNTASAITVQPSTATQTVCQNSAFAPVTITATGSPTLLYQWYRNTTASTTGGTALTGGAFAAEIANGSKTASYTPLSNVIGTYYYYVQVSNGCNTVKSTNTTGAFTVVAPAVTGTVSSAQIICAGSVPSDLTLAGYSGTIVKWQKATDAAFTAGIQDYVNTTPTLAGASIGALSQTTYFRAFVENGTCPAVATTGIQIQIKSTTWTTSWSNGVPDSATTAIFAGDYNSPGNLDACSVQVLSGNVVFNSNQVLTIQNGLDVSGGTLTFENNASLIQLGNTVNSGPITYKRDTTGMSRYDYTYWSSPVDAQILANFSPGTLSDKYFWWNTTTYSWNSVTAPGITLMDIGKGYIIRAPQSFDPVSPAVFNGAFTGVPNNGDYVVPIVMTDATHDLNLIGNPYPSAIDADLFMSDPANTASIGTGTSIYLWTHNTPITAYDYTTNDYATYCYSGGTATSFAPSSGINNNTPNGFIAAGQAFMIKGLATGSATFKNSMRTGIDNSQFFRTASQNSTSAQLEKNRVWLDLKNNQGAFKQALVGYIENATNGLDPGFDAEIIEAGNPVSLYSVLDNSKLVIQGRALPFNIADQIPIGYRTTVAGNFEIALSNFDGLFENQDVFLEDKLLNVVQNLKTESYAFVTETGVFDTRFVLRFGNSVLSTVQTDLNPNAIVIYKNGNLIAVNSGKTPMAEVTIFDITGRLIAERKSINANEAMIDAGTTNEVLIVRVKTLDGFIFSKKIVN